MVRMTRLHLVLRGAAALSLALGGFGLGTTALGADGPAPVLIGHIDGEINPITARYVDRVVSDGESDNAAAVVFVIDTPGGLIDSTYQITARFLATRVPIVTFVAPAGARAASAGTFITMAGHVAAMAPATNIVDLQANDVSDLLAKIDGRTVTTSAGSVTLATKNAPVVDDGQNPFETLLHFVVDPQIAVLLFTLGTDALIFE